MTPQKHHWCESCKGTGIVVSQRTRKYRGVKRTYEFLVDCPGKLTDQLLQGHPEVETGAKSRMS